MTLLGSDDKTELLRRWSEPSRSYHGERHLQECLETFQQVRHLAQDPDAVEFALWLHDAIYDPHLDDNELQSATLARAMLMRGDVEPARIATIEAMILATKHDVLVSHPDARLVCDIDLGILAASERRFDEYQREIRREYLWVPSEMYAARRGEILSRFLARASIYQTSHFRARLEWKARVNLARAIEALRSDTAAR